MGPGGPGLDLVLVTAKPGGERRASQFFAMRSMASGDAFDGLQTTRTQEAFLEVTNPGPSPDFEGVLPDPRHQNLTDR